MPVIGDGIYVLSAAAVYAIIWSVTAFAVAITFLRLYTRSFIVKCLGLDDALISFGLVGSVAITALLHWHVHVVWESYYWGLRLNFRMLNKKLDIVVLSTFISECFAILLLPIIKCSILAFYRRISPSKKHHYLLYVLATSMIFVGVLHLFLKIFAVNPPLAWLHYHTQPDHKMNYRFEDLHTTNSALQVLFDIIILLLPARIIYRTRFNRRQRIGLLVVYLLSFLSLVATIARLVSLRRFASNDDLSLFVRMEERIKYSYWIIIEIMTVIICANLPTMPALVHVIKRTISKALSPSPSTALPPPPPRFHHLHPYALPLYGNTSSHAFSTNPKSGRRSSNISKWRWTGLFNHTNPHLHSPTATTTTTATSLSSPPMREKIRQSRDTLVSLGKVTDGKDSSSKSIITSAPAQETEMANNPTNDANCTFYISRVAPSEYQSSMRSNEEATGPGGGAAGGDNGGAAVTATISSPASSSSSASSHHRDRSGSNVGFQGVNHSGAGAGAGAVDGAGPDSIGVIYRTDEFTVERSVA